MSDQLLALLPTYGLPLLGLIVGLGCLGVPLPSALIILLCASLTTVGEFDAFGVFTVALGSAIIGDQLGFALGRIGQANIEALKHKYPTLNQLHQKANAYLQRRGAIAVFLSRWLASPLGPAVNLIAGAANMPWKRFSLFGITGEIVWVSIYTMLGVMFGGYVLQVADIAANASGLIAALAVALIMGRSLWRSRGAPKPKSNH
ncbi:MAG: hypothetical protein COA52_17235 [Hyphomicrobiales bacterium]|nr:DedA family protein [Hyphomicrobiales bacterium]PCJ84584.1 MAG: hypothetical protein COA52_17235 [Hyphomicrobiales bacterium]